MMLSSLVVIDACFHICRAEGSPLTHVITTVGEEYNLIH